MPTRPCVVLAVLVGAALNATGDEAVRGDGSRVAGRLTLTDTGRFTFTAADRSESVARLDQFQFAPKAPPDPPAALWHQVHLGRGEVVRGEIRRLDDHHLHLRTAWADTLAVPRAAIEGVTFAPGWRPVFFDSFDAGLASWTTAGNPRAAGGQTVFDKDGQAVEVSLKPPVAAGRVGTTFRSATTTARRLTLELEFVDGGQRAPVCVELIGPGEHYAITSQAKPDHEGRLRRAVGARRLTAEFDRDRLQVFVDGWVLWSQESGPGLLRTIKLVAAGAGTESAAVDDVLVADAGPVLRPRDWADLTRDAVRSRDGDETFGALTAAGPGGVTLQAQGHKAHIAWPAAAELGFRRGPVSERMTAGEHVRVVIRTADGGRDVLDGAVKTFDETSLVLAHATLGDLKIPRDRLEELRFRFFGRTLPVDAAPHHLGARPAFGFAIPKPEGLRLVKSVAVEMAPLSGFVVVDAARVGAKGTPVEMLLNGERLQELNQFADRPGADVKTYRVPVPAAAWRIGDSEVVIRLRADAGDRQVNSVDVRAVRLELHDKR
ncbi:MAG TPA: hypothetical protein VKE40_03175 [Gemmataceae bacterium]|nr:hypothetical protein [Gemmataceae bacterium]